jgi:hypothetical protein
VIGHGLEQRASEFAHGLLGHVRQFLPVAEALSARYPAFRTLQLSPVFKTPAEVELGSLLFWDMTEDAILLYNKNSFLQNHLEGVKQRLRELKARRVFKGNAWCWILKGDYKPGEVFEL